MVNEEAYKHLSQQLAAKNVTLVAVSKMKPAEDILALYNLGQRDFGENYVQELVEKQAKLPHDIRWHFIGHLQSNKVKYIAPFIHLIHSIDNVKLLRELNKQAKKNNRVVPCLLQMHIAQEDTKFGLDDEELKQLLETTTSAGNEWTHVHLKGLMGMASNTDDESRVRKEFAHLNALLAQYSSVKSPLVDLSVLSMGMSGDYEIAIEEGSTMIRVGSLLFGARNYNS